MSTTLGSGMWERFDIHDGEVWFERRNLGCHIEDGPESHGSMRIVNVPGACGCWKPGKDGGRLPVGEKVRRKVVSPLRCLTVRDMT